MKVADVQAVLEARWPQADAESWDRVGLLQGKPEDAVTHVVCALDPDFGTLLRARDLGADLLVTHHPTYLPPEPEAPAPEHGADLEYAARKMGIALIACHTNLDVCEEARLSLGTGLPLESRGVMADFCDEEDTGFEHPRFAQLWWPTIATSVPYLATLLTDIYKTPVLRTLAPGGYEETLESVATATGSGGDAVEAAVSCYADLLITGELKYHQRLEASDRGLSVIELGHDISEWPLVTLLYDALKPACESASTQITLMERFFDSKIIVPRKGML